MGGGSPIACIGPGREQRSGSPHLGVSALRETGNCGGGGGHTHSWPAPCPPQPSLPFSPPGYYRAGMGPGAAPRYGMGWMGTPEGSRERCGEGGKRTGWAGGGQREAGAQRGREKGLKNNQFIKMKKMKGKKNYGRGKEKNGGGRKRKGRESPQPREITLHNFAPPLTPRPDPPAAQPRPPAAPNARARHEPQHRPPRPATAHGTSGNRRNGAGGSGAGMRGAAGAPGA